MDAHQEALKAGLRESAERCINGNDPEWWSATITDSASFHIANAHLNDVEPDAGDFAKAGDAATFLLIVAEAI